MEKLSWIKDLVLAEQQMEESGVVEMEPDYDPGRHLEEATTEFLNDLKHSFVEVSSAFNQLKGSTHGHLRIYGISKTKADFMLFRNGYKLIFSLRQPGVIAVTYSSAGTQYALTSARGSDEAEPKDILRAAAGAFGQLVWTHNDHLIDVDHLIRFYMSRFVKDSAK